MATFEWIIVLLLGAALLATLARRVGAPYPTFLAIGGALLAFVPSSPNWTLDPHLALALFVAPILVDAAYDTSLRDLRANWAAGGRTERRRQRAGLSCSELRRSRADPWGLAGAATTTTPR